MKYIKCLHCKSSFEKKYKQQKFCSLLCSNRFNRNNLSKVILPRKSKSLAEFIGIVLGDGSVSKYFTEIALNSIVDIDYVEYVADLAAGLFKDASVTKIPKKNENLIRVQISSRMVADFLRNMGLIPKRKKIPGWILRSSEYRKACIKGLVDTEGSISFKLYQSRKGTRVYKQLNFRNADINLIRFVRDTLTELGLHPTKSLRRSLYLSNHESVANYRAMIGFGNAKLRERSSVIDFPSYRRWRGA